MALQTSITIQDLGLTLPTPYIRISRVWCRRTLLGLMDVELSLDIFASSEVKDTGCAIRTQSFGFQCPSSQELSMASLYTYLKTLPEFANAIDV